MVFDSTTTAEGDTAVMRTMRLKSKVPQQCLDFAYYMDLVEGSSASIKYVLLNETFPDRPVLK